MRRSLVLRFLPVACALTVASFGANAQQAPAPASGIDRSTADPAVRIQDDAFRAVEGKWLADSVIPPDRTSIGGFDALYEKTQPELRGLIEGTASGGAADAADAKKIGDLYASFMDEARIESLGIRPIAADLAKIDGLLSRGDLASWIGGYDGLGIDTPFSIVIDQDAKDSSKYVVAVAQGGIGLPDRDYFLIKGDRRFAEVRARYEAHLARLLTMVGEPDAAAKAHAVVALEAAIARAQWSRVENRDPQKTYNVVALADLPKLAPHIDWTRWLDAEGLTGKVATVVVSQPGYVRGLDPLFATVPLATWKAYFKTRVMAANAALLDKAFVDEQFAFTGTTLNGVPENTARWKRGVKLVEAALGEGLGRLYVAAYFPPESKARMDALVANLLAAYKVSIDGLDWMTPETKKEAQAKLATFMPKIGYPVRWRDYAALAIDRDDLVGNVRRSNAFEHRREIDKLGKPVDRDEWGMTPQTINAYYNAGLNEIVFPAAMLQPPFFDAQADDAANYGAIGAVIGHEISHGFDDSGSQFDGQGNLRNWWTREDRRRFAAKTRALIAQYGAYSPVPGYRINGALTLGENIADNAGLAIAYKAYRLSLKGRPAPTIDGLSGDQRFYMGYAQAWKEKNREAALVTQLKSDPHAPGEFRANGALTNQTAFYEAFGVKPGDRMYTAPGKRVIIW